MSKENSKKLVALFPVIKAHSEGKTVQYKGPSCKSWEDIKDPLFVGNPLYYRIKPELVERWINVYPHMSDYSYDTEESAVRSLSDRGRTVHMKEVTD